MPRDRMPFFTYQAPTLQEQQKYIKAEKIHNIQKMTTIIDYMDRLKYSEINTDRMYTITSLIASMPLPPYITLKTRRTSSRIALQKIINLRSRHLI